jgi:MFS family permease
VAVFALVRRSPGLAGLLAAQTISPLGDAMATTALILHVQRTTGSATAVGLLLFAQAIPPLAAPFAGVVADRVAPGRLLGVGWLAQAILAGLLALSLPPLGALLAVVFVLALLDTPLSAAVGRCIPAVVTDDDLVAANALRSGVQELGTVLGPPLAGLLFAASGARLVLGLDAFTFLVVIPLALRLPAPPRDTSVRTRPSFARDARDGLAFVWRTPSVLAIALGFWVVVLFSAPDDLILPFLATLTSGAGPVAVGVLLAAAPAGLLAGLAFVRPAGRRLGVTGAIVAGFAVMATGNLLTAAVPWLIAAFAAQMLRGLAIPLANSHVSTYLQRTTPPELLGRVLANVYGGVGVAAAAGYLIGGPIVDATSPRAAFVIVGCGGLARRPRHAPLRREYRVRRSRRRPPQRRAGSRLRRGRGSGLGPGRRRPAGQRRAGGRRCR